MTAPSPLRKRPLEADAATSVRDNDEIDIAGCATIAYSSENPAHPVEHLLDRRSGPGTTRWISARPDTVEHIVVELARRPTLPSIAAARRLSCPLREMAFDRGLRPRQIRALLDPS
jgi:hypothetical protein